MALIFSVNQLNKNLKRAFGGKVRALEVDGCLVLEGEVERWDDVVRAGTMAVKGRGRKGRVFIRGLQAGKGPRLGGVVNNITCSGVKIPATRLPPLRDGALEGLRPDVLVIGGGVTGCAVARELARYKLDVLLIEKEHDLGMHSSSRNDSMVHPGIDLRKGSWKHYYNRRGNPMYDELSADLGVHFERPGQYLCFSEWWLKPALYLTLLYWKWLGIPGVRVLGKKELHRLEPGIRDDLVSALYFPSAGIVDTFNLTIGLGENAVENGVRLSLDTAVTEMKGEGGRIVSVATNRGTVYPGVVVNAAGTFAEDVAAMAGDRFYSIHPRRGIAAILDKKYTRGLVRTIASRQAISGLKSRGHTKGGGMVLTAHGNLLVGPDAVETWEKENFATHTSSTEAIFSKFTQTSPALNPGQTINYFAGVRAPTYEEDFVVCKGRRVFNLVHAAGIQSPGLTAAPAIGADAARFAVELLRAGGRTVEANRDFNPRRKPIPHTAAMEPEERAALIRENPDYGIIFCRCEEVSKGEILDALRRPVPCDTLDGVKRRVRPGAGRCLGGFCGPLVLQLIAGEKGIPLDQVLKSGLGSAVLCGPNKAFAGQDEPASPSGPAPDSGSLVMARTENGEALS